MAAIVLLVGSLGFLLAVLGMAMVVGPVLTLIIRSPGAARGDTNATSAVLIGAMLLIVVGLGFTPAPVLWVARLLTLALVAIVVMLVRVEKRERVVH